MVFAAIIACRSLAKGAGEADITSKLLALESMWNRAAEAKDLRALDAIVDDDFVYVESDGKLLTKSEFLAEIHGAKGFQLALESRVVRLHGNTAVVTGIYRRTGLEHGKPFMKRERFVDTWRQKNGIWVWIASLFTPLGS